MFEPQRDFHHPRNNRPKREVLNQYGGPNSTSTIFTSQAPTRRPEAEGGGSWTQTGRKDPRDPKSISIFVKGEKSSLTKLPHNLTTFAPFKSWQKGKLFPLYTENFTETATRPGAWSSEAQGPRRFNWDHSKVRHIHIWSNFMSCCRLEIDQHQILIYHIFRAFAEHTGILARNDKLRLLLQRTELNHIPEFPTDRGACTLNILPVGSTFTFPLPPPKKKTKTHVCFSCIV